MLHLVKWSRPEISNAVRELTRFMSGAGLVHQKAMDRSMKYCIGTPNRGKVLKPRRMYDGSKDFEFEISGTSDSDYANNPERRRCVSGGVTFLEGAPVAMKCHMQGSVTEAETIAAVETVQDMIYTNRVLESIGLKVKTPMVLEMDNKGAIDLANNWSSGGRTRHVETRFWFLRELKEDGILMLKWIPTEHMCADIFTKNCPGPLFEIHTSVFCGTDEYSPGLN